MGDDEKDVLSDEAIAEQEKEAVAEGAELRSQVAAALGIADDEANKELLDKAVTRESGLRKGYGTLLGKYKGLKTKVKPAPQQAPQQQQQSQQGKALTPEEIRQQAEATVTQQLEQRDLDEMELPDDIKSEIKSVAKIKGISVRKAAQDGYIQHLIEKAVAENRITDAALPSTRRAAPAARPGNAAAPKFDMSTEEGRKAFNEWKQSKGSK